MIKIPEKQIIVNDDSQVQLLEEDGTAYADGDVTPSAGSFILAGFLPIIAGSDLVLLDTATRVVAQAASAAVAGAIRIECLVDGGVAKGDVFRVNVKNDQRVPVELQQYQPLEKRYQFSADIAAAAGSDHTVATAIADTINGDPNALVTAAVVAGVGNEGAVEITAKNPGDSVEFYADSPGNTFALASSPAATIGITYDTGKSFETITAAAAAINTYDALKNINWAKNLDFDRNSEYFPQKGVSYKSYAFQYNWTAKDTGGIVVPSQSPIAGRVAAKLWVNPAATTLTAAMNLFTDDVNV